LSSVIQPQILNVKFLLLLLFTDDKVFIDGSGGELWWAALALAHTVLKEE
jgi:hypothetical protein